MCVLCEHAYMYVCMYVCIYACMQTCKYAGIHVCMFTSMFVFMCVCMNACMIICVDISIFKSVVWENKVDNTFGRRLRFFEFAPSTLYFWMFLSYFDFYLPWFVVQTG